MIFSFATEALRFEYPLGNLQLCGTTIHFSL